MLIKGHPSQKKALSNRLTQMTYFVSVSKPPSPNISMLPPYVHKQRNFSVSIEPDDLLCGYDYEGNKRNYV